MRDFLSDIFRFRFLSASSRLSVNKTKKGKKINLGQLERISAASSVGGHSFQLKIFVNFFFKIVEFIWPGKILLCPRIFTKKFKRKEEHQFDDLSKKNRRYSCEKFFKKRNVKISGFQEYYELIREGIFLINFKIKSRIMDILH